MKTKLILGCGIGRCGTGFLSYFMFMNPDIAVWDGPGMGELCRHVEGKANVPLSDLHEIWGDDYQEPTHGSKDGGLSDWDGINQFDGYYGRRITERRKSNAYFISHVMGERWVNTYHNNFDCDITVIYCARNIVDHYRSFKRWYYVDGVAPEYFLDRLRGSLAQMKDIQEKGIAFVTVNIPDYSMKDLRQKLGVVMAKIGIPQSKEQILFLKKRRELAPSKAVLDATDNDLLGELRQVSDFDNLKSRYDALRKGKHEAKFEYKPRELLR